MKRIAVLGTALAFLLAARPDRAQSPARPDSAAASNRHRFRLLGVYDATSGEPVEGVEVADFLNGISALTTKTGTVSLFFLPDGGALVRLRKIGYETQTLAVSITPADTLPITVVLSHATSLPAVVVKDSAPKFMPPGLRAFEEHRKLGFGHFLTDSLFRKYESSTLANFLTSRLPSDITVAGPNGAKYLVSGRRMCSGPALRACKTPDCFVSVYQDGAKIFDSSNPGGIRVDFEHMSSRDYEAAEFYQGAEIPAEYNSTGSACGVLVLWSRTK